MGDWPAGCQGCTKALAHPAGGVWFRGWWLWWKGWLCVVLVDRLGVLGWLYLRGCSAYGPGYSAAFGHNSVGGPIGTGLSGSG